GRCARAAPAADVPPADRRPGRPAHRRRRSGHLRRPAGAGGRVRVPAGAVADAATARRRTGRAARLLDLRPGRGVPADRRPRGARRAVLLLAGARDRSRRRGRGAAAVGPVHHRPVHPGGARLRGGRVRDHAGALAGVHGAGRRAVHRDAALRQPAGRHGDVRRRAGRPQGPVRPAPDPPARALAGGPRRRRDQRPARGRAAAPARRVAARRPSGGPLVAVRAARAGHRCPGRARRARCAAGTGAPGALLRRRRPARAGARGRGHRRRSGQRGDRRPRRPGHAADPAPGRAGAGRRAAGARRPALRLQGRRLRHLPGAGHRGGGADAPQLRARARRGGGRLRPDLPVPAGVGPAHRRLRPV
ncbi:MAG: 1,2-phenylacetyl-CoA epoxidase, subunit E, partial [uncultured Blastococcus sp.]